MSNHCYLQLRPRVRDSKVLRECALAFVNYQFNSNLSRNRLLKIGAKPVQWWTVNPDGKMHFTSVPISLRIIEEKLNANGKVSAEELKLRPMKCDWLDASVAIQTNFHMVDSSGETLKFHTPPRLGPDFPVKPILDREGGIYSSFQGLLQKNLLECHRWIVEHSNAFSTDEWFHRLRLFIGDAVSLVDLTLHNIYLKAQYDPAPGWKYDPDRLGSRHGQRLNDKLGWVFQIAGQHINETEQERDAFNALRELRNHLQHFDPPCFCFTLENVARWLNLLQPFAHFLWRIRKAVGSPLSEGMIEMLLEPQVEFKPSHPEKPRAPQTKKTGIAVVAGRPKSLKRHEEHSSLPSFSVRGS